MEIAILVMAWLLLSVPRAKPMANGPMPSIGDLLRSPFPDWVKVLVIGAFLGFSYAGMSRGQDEIRNELMAIRFEMAHVARADSIRWSVSQMNMQRLLRQSNIEHLRMWRAIGRPENARDIE